MTTDSSATSVEILPCAAARFRARANRLACPLVLVVALLGCSSNSEDAGTDTGGAESVGGSSGAATASGGTSGQNQGGSVAAGTGSTEAGASGAGGGGGASGASSGGAATGGVTTGGTAAGGVTTGGTAAGGAMTGGTAAGGAGGAAGNTGGGMPGGGSAGSGADLGLHVDGNLLKDGAGERVVMRGPELVVRWGVYSGITPLGVDVAWEGGSNNNVGSSTIAEMAKTKANAIRIYGGIGNGLEAILHAAIVEQKMFVGVGRVDWTNPQMKATLQKYAKYVMLHPRGEFTHSDASLWRTEALKVVKEIRALGYTSAIEIGTTGYGQTWSTIEKYGKEVAASDPLKNTLFLLQLYSELASDINGTLTRVSAFSQPVNVGACLFNEGIKNNYGNDTTTYQTVWNETWKRNIGSFYWDFWGDGNGNSMSTGGTLASFNAIGQFIANDSTGALKNSVKTPYLLAASVP